MTGILGKFHVEHNAQGTRVMARADRLTPSCTSEVEVDMHIQMLKEDLDSCAKEMKRLLEVNRRGALFEGWPTSRDAVGDI